jgi:predicted transcriptional regulator
MRPLPTPAELRILQVLWERGPCSAREVHEILATDQDTTYTSTLKLLQLMLGKRLVVRDESEVRHIYAAVVPREATESHLVADFARRVFAGSSEELVMRALGRGTVSAADAARIRALLDRSTERRG